MGKARGLLEQELQLPAGGLKPSKALCAEVIDEVMRKCNCRQLLRDGDSCRWLCCQLTTFTHWTATGADPQENNCENHSIHPRE